MNIEEYIKKRKSEDGINEYDKDKRSENLRLVVNYVFEYFNNYLDTIPEQEQELLKDKRIIRYQKLITQYSNETQNWLITMYIQSHHYVDRMIIKLIKNVPFFLLFDTDAEFRAISYEIYAELKKQLKDVPVDAELLFKFIKEHHKTISKLDTNDDLYYVTEDVTKWILDTYANYGVNLYEFCFERLEHWFDNPEIWPKGHRKKSKNYEKYKNTNTDPSLMWAYNYKASSNVFGIDDLYKKIPKKKFIAHHKKHLEILSMCIWLREFDGNSEYWDDYVNNI